MRSGGIALLIAVTTLIGCSHAYQVQPAGGNPSNVRLPSDATIFVGLPKDGRYGTTLYRASGRVTYQAIISAFSHHSRFVRSARTVMDREGNVTAAREDGARYLIHAEILHWEDRATHWSGRSDHISVRMLLVDVPTGNTLDSTLISGKSRWLTFGGDRPEDLLHAPLKQYTAQLFDEEYEDNEGATAAHGRTHAQIGDRVQELANQLSMEIHNHSISRIAVLPISDASRQVNRPLGNYLTETLTTALYKTASVKVVERFQLDRVIDELALTMTGRFNDASVKQIGRLLGVDALIIGTYVELGTRNVEVNSRIVAVETGEVLGAGTVQIPRRVVWHLL